VIFHKEVAMDFKARFPDFAAVEQQVRRAHAERSVYIAHVLANFLVAMGGGIKRFATGGGLNAVNDRVAIESDAFLKRSVPKY
jgi:hypothetical protein